MKKALFILLFFGALFGARQVHAQHTLGVTGGYGSGTFRPYPAEETRQVWGVYTAGISWRHYTAQRFVGGFGLDLEYLRRGFSYVPYPSQYDDKSQYKWYTRQMHSILLPIVWQPHVYAFRHRVRFFLDLSAYFSYNISSTYRNEYYHALYPGRDDWKGDYPYRLTRDNRWGYGLAGGGGLAVLAGRFEFSVRVRYYFGYSDQMRNRNKYPDNLIDNPAENPFDLTPIRSPMDNLTFSFGVAYRFNRTGFEEWNRRPLRERRSAERFDYKME